LPPPLRLIPLLLPLVVLRLRADEEAGREALRLPDAEREPAPERDEPLVVSPAVSSIIPPELPPPLEPMLSVHSPI
jgi:hypothetical protein